MNRVHQHFAWQASTFFVAILLADDASAQCARYSVKRPQPLGICGILGEVFPPTNISPQGDLVGEWSCSGGNERAMVVWDAQKIALLPLPNTEVATAEDMNSKAAIVGTRAVSDLGYRGFIYQNGQITDLGWLPDHNWAEAYSVSDNEVVVGFSSNVQTGPVIACRWMDGVVESLGIDGIKSRAFGSNNTGQIVGWMGTSLNPAFGPQAFLSEDGVTVTLPLPANAIASRAVAISSTGNICGSFWISNPNGGAPLSRPVLWSNKEVVSLGLLPAFAGGTATDLNNMSVVVGYCQNPPQLGNNLTGFIWRNGVIRKLDDFIIPNPEQYRVQRAVGINDNGQIAVNLSDGKDAARLDPIPPRPGDTNCDWLVNVIDLLAVINAWGPAPPPVPFEGSPDLNSDGTVNVLDLLAVITDWG